MSPDTNPEAARRLAIASLSRNWQLASALHRAENTSEDEIEARIEAEIVAVRSQRAASPAN